MFIYDAKSKKNDQNKYVAEFRITNRDVKELCHLHDVIVEDL